MYQLPSSMDERFTDSELESEFETLSQSLRALLGLQGRQDGMQDKNIDEQYFRIHVWSLIKNKVQSILNKCFHKHQPASSVINTRDHRSETNERMNKLNVLFKSAERAFELLVHECAVAKSMLVPMFSHTLKIMILAGLIGSEIGLLFTLLRSGSFAIPYAVLISFAIGIGTLLSMRFGANYICKASTPEIRKVRYWTIVLISVVIIGAMGLWRASLSEEISTTKALLGLRTTGSGSTTSIPYILTSFILFVSGLQFEIYTWLPESEKLKHRKYKERMRDKDEAKVVMDKYAQEIHELSKNSLTVTASSIARLEWAAGFEQRLCNLADELRNVYERAYFEQRMDRNCPKFFGVEMSWNFTVYFTDLFKNIKSK